MTTLAKFDQDFRSIHNSIHNTGLIGFDDLFMRIKELEKPQTGFPPYDIIRVTDEKFVIKLAVAGYKKENISVVLDSGKLIISGTSNRDEPPVKYEYKGIAERDFMRKFTLANTVEVERTVLLDGMLYVNLQNIIPESKRPKIFTIE